MKTKKYILGMLAAAGLMLTTSCSDDMSMASASGDTQKVTFSLGLEGQMQTSSSRRAPDIIGGDDYNAQNTRISDGTRATHLIMEVYTAEGEPYSFYEATERANGRPNRLVREAAQFPITDISVTLEKDKDYRVVFWADTPDNPYYDTDNLRNIGIRYDVVESDMKTGQLNNDELRDAFCFSDNLLSTDLSSSQTRDITLRRPLAQINVGTTQKDWDAVMENYPIKESKITINYVGNRFDLVADKAVVNGMDGRTTADYQYATIPSLLTEISGREIKEENRALQVKVKANEDGTFSNSDEPESYKWLSMCYILVPEDGGDGVVDITEIKFKTKDDSELMPFEKGLTNVPVKRNYRTNIIGSVFTKTETFTVELDQNFAGDFNNLNLQGWDGEIADGLAYQAKEGYSKYGTSFRSGLNFYVSSAKGLQWLADRSNREPLAAKDIPGWFSGDLDAYKKFVYAIIDKRTFIDNGVTEARFNNNDPWTYDECTIYLTKDINWKAEMGDEAFRPFSMRHGITGGSSVEHKGTFKGEFDGQGHTISNLKIDTRSNDDPPSNGAFIAAATDDATIKNLRLYAADIKASWNVGGFVGRYAYSNGTHTIKMENCILENSEIYAEIGHSPSNDANIGGLIGATGPSTIKNCHIINTKLESTYIAGGLFGICFGNSTVEDCSISDVAIVINEMNADIYNTGAYVRNALYNEYWICGTRLSGCGITQQRIIHDNVYRNVFLGTRDRSGDEDSAIGEIYKLPLQWFPQLYGGWADGVTLKSHITGTPSYYPEGKNWCAGIYISTEDIKDNEDAEKYNPDYILSGETREGKALYAINVQKPATPAECYGVYLTGKNTATIQDLVINGDPSITAGIYLDKASDVVLSNVAVYDVVNTILDANNVPQNAKLSVTKCDLRGTTQYSANYASVTFTGTTFRKGSGTTTNKNNKSVIPGSATTFSGCVFEQGFTVDLKNLANGQVTFENCQIEGSDGKKFALTSANVSSLVTGGENYTVR
ncbi:MAG: hypothetical protein J1E37_00155 [Prevotella sp.]|nr:hypothetical protein [Prevotella sp.]